MRSAKAPAISAGVMIAKLIWNITKTDSGTVVARWCTDTWPRFLSKTMLSRNIATLSPTSGVPGMNARL